MPDDLPFDENATPTKNPDLDIESISETPSSDEFFLYSRIDGQQTVGQLCTTAGLGREKTLEALRRLVGFGVVEIPGVDPSDVTDDEGDDAAESTDAADGEVDEDERREGSDGRASPSVAESSDDEAETHDSEAEETPLTELDLGYLPVPPEEFEFDREAMVADVPLEAPLRREVLCLQAQADDLNHYEFFGLSEDAGKGEIKKAYFKFSKRFHPDKHFGKDIGAFKDRIEEVFQKITRAHRTLSDPEKRETYDEKLEGQRASNATGVDKSSSVEIASEEATKRSEAADSSEGEADKRSQAFERLVEVADELGDREKFDEASKKYRKALSLRRDAGVARRAARLLYETEHDLEEASLFARAALEIEDGEGTPETRLLLGRIFEARGDESGAEEQYEAALEIDPDHDEAEARYQSLVG